MIKHGAIIWAFLYYSRTHRILASWERDRLCSLPLVEGGGISALRMVSARAQAAFVIELGQLCDAI